MELSRTERMMQFLVHGAKTERRSQIRLIIEVIEVHQPPCPSSLSTGSTPTAPGMSWSPNSDRKYHIYAFILVSTKPKEINYASSKGRVLSYEFQRLETPRNFLGFLAQLKPFNPKIKTYFEQNFGLGSQKNSLNMG